MKKKFDTESEVIALIDKYHDDIKHDLCEIETFSVLADALRMTREAYRIPRIRDEVETFHRQIEWRQGRLESLRDILAELRTLELPFKNETPIHQSVQTTGGDLHSGGDASSSVHTSSTLETGEL
jgi:hypothetical protein